MNILMLDERTAVVEQAEEPMMGLLRTLGCEVIPVAFERVYPFGGGFHCCTADIRGEGFCSRIFRSGAELTRLRLTFRRRPAFAS
jgi:glycine amidinotransferase